MKTIKLALLGLGTVGAGVYKSIIERKGSLEKLLGAELNVTHVLIKDSRKSRCKLEGASVTALFEEVFQNGAPDVIIEAMGGIEPAHTYIKQALNAGCHVISANKDLIARHGSELLALAAHRNVRFVYEASVGGGIPVLRTLRELLRINHIQQIEGILNGTSNFILSHMRTEGASFTDALKLAQAKGYAEPDPTNDIEGLDAFYKAMVLSQWIYGRQPSWEQAQIAGIGGVEREDLQLGENLGLRLKHLVLLNDELALEVKPVFVDGNHPLYHVEGVDNAVRIQTDLLGCLTLQGPGAGAEATASAIVEDLLSLYEANHVYNNKPAPSKVRPLQNEKQDEGTFLLIGAEPRSLKHLLASFMDEGKVLEHTSYKTEKGFFCCLLYQGTLPERSSWIERVYAVRLAGSYERVKEKIAVQ